MKYPFLTLVIDTARGQIVFKETYDRRIDALLSAEIPSEEKGKYKNLVGIVYNKETQRVIYAESYVNALTD